MKWVPYLLALAVGFLLCLLMKGDPTEAGQAWLDSLNVERERSRVLALADSASQRRVDSLLGVIGLIQIDTAAQRRLREANARAREAALLARHALDSARTASDSLRLVFVALGASEAHRDTLEQEVRVLRMDLEATGRLLALTRQVQQETAAQRDSARAEAGRWKLRAVDAEAIIERGSSTGQRIGRAAETVAMGAATVGACSDGVFTLGCLTGGVATGRRLF